MNIFELGVSLEADAEQIGAAINGVFNAFDALNDEEKDRLDDCIPQLDSKLDELETTLRAETLHTTDERYAFIVGVSLGLLAGKLVELNKINSPSER